MDVSHRALEIAGDGCAWTGCRRRQRERIQLLHGSLTYRDRRLAGFDAAAVVEVIEHLDPPRLARLRARRCSSSPGRGTVVADHAQRRVQRHVRDAARRPVPPPRPPLRVDARRVPGLGQARRRPLRLHASASCRSARRTPRSAPPTQMAVFTRCKLDACDPARPDSRERCATARFATISATEANPSRLIAEAQEQPEASRSRSTIDVAAPIVAWSASAMQPLHGPVAFETDRPARLAVFRECARSRS